MKKKIEIGLYTAITILCAVVCFGLAFFEQEDNVYYKSEVINFDDGYIDKYEELPIIFTEIPDYIYNGIIASDYDLANKYQEWDSMDLRYYDVETLTIQDFLNIDDSVYNLFCDGEITDFDTNKYDMYVDYRFDELLDDPFDSNVHESIILDGNISNNQLCEIAQLLKNLPPWMPHVIFDQDWKFIICSDAKKVCGYYGIDCPDSVTSRVVRRSDKESLFIINAAKMKNIFSCVEESVYVYDLLHEFGHVFDYNIDSMESLSSSETYKRIANEEFITFYGQTSATEHFAESFAAWLYYPEEFKVKCPQTYEFLDYYCSYIFYDEWLDEVMTGCEYEYKYN